MSGVAALLVGGFLVDLGIDFGGGDTVFNLDNLRRVYDSRALAALARAAGQDAWSDEKEERAVRQLLIAEPEPGPPTIPPA